MYSTINSWSIYILVSTMQFLISLVMFFLSTLVNFFFIIALHGANTVLGGSRGFDLYAGPVEDALLAEQIDYSIGMIVDGVNLRVTKKMVSPEFHSFIRRFFFFFFFLYNWFEYHLF